MPQAIVCPDHRPCKYPLFDRAGDVHVHCTGIAMPSRSTGFTTQFGDVSEAEAVPFHLPVRHPIAIGWPRA